MFSCKTLILCLVNNKINKNIAWFVSMLQLVKDNFLRKKYHFLSKKSVYLLFEQQEWVGDTDLHESSFIKLGQNSHS